MENADSIKIDEFKSTKDFQLSSEQQSKVQGREANNKPSDYVLSSTVILFCHP